MDLSKIIQFMIFVIFILIMAKVFGFADNGYMVLIAVLGGGAVFILIMIVSTQITNHRKAKAEREGNVPTIPKKVKKKKNPYKKK